NSVALPISIRTVIIPIPPIRWVWLFNQKPGSTAGFGVFDFLALCDESGGGTGGLLVREHLEKFEG
ncbi:MAG: hypothetical protein M3178_08135, partial [Pseudomonadota bacterium]|nr:hypothetical protein [Pseudomonadota bacterium]